MSEYAIKNEIPPKEKKIKKMLLPHITYIGPLKDINKRTDQGHEYHFKREVPVTIFNLRDFQFFHFDKKMGDYLCTLQQGNMTDSFYFGIKRELAKMLKWGKETNIPVIEG